MAVVGTPELCPFFPLLSSPEQTDRFRRKQESVRAVWSVVTKEVEGGEGGNRKDSEKLWTSFFASVA